MGVGRFVWVFARRFVRRNSHNLIETSNKRATYQQVALLFIYISTWAYGHVIVYFTSACILLGLVTISRIQYVPAVSVGV